jgi:hypothetical protein
LGAKPADAGELVTSKFTPGPVDEFGGTVERAASEFADTAGAKGEAALKGKAGFGFVPLA